ncbi:MAG: twin-arginine translocation pathway signal protein [Rubritepida sp.]|nr:twin-arginine translocation pathway signal protein [Rubritepida sp.]
MNRRQLLAVAPLLAAPAAVRAQPAWPARPVRVVIPFTPGGASDLMMRPVAERLERVLGQPFVIDNRAGGGGRWASEPRRAPHRTATPSC